MATKTVPSIVVTAMEETSEPMTTSVALEQFDFGEMTKSELDTIVAEMDSGETRTVECKSYDVGFWSIIIKRTEE